MLIIDCDLQTFISENIPLGDDKEDDSNETFPLDYPKEEDMEEVVIKEE